MKTFREFLSEGVRDPGIFKAIFLAGGPGSGKTFVVGKALPNAAFGLKVLNSDDIFQFLLKKSGPPIDMLKMTPAQLEKRETVRDTAFRIKDARKKGFLDGRLGMIIDGTGANFDRLKDDREELKSFGYDTMMIFVDTSLEVATQRNLARARKLSKEVVTDSWNGAQTNKRQYQSLFGRSNFIIVDNNDISEDLILKTFKAAKKFVSKPIQSKLAKAWIASERARK